MSRRPDPRAHPSYLVLLDLVGVSEALRKAANRFFGSHGLTQTQFNVLMVLKHQTPDGCSQRELCRRLVVNAADISALVRRMLARGLIDRQDHPTDTRAWLVHLSAKGGQLLNRVEPLYYQQVEQAMRRLSPHQVSSFARLLDQVRQGIHLIGQEAA